MATLHAAPGELIDIRPFDDMLRQATSTTLARTEHLDFFRLMLAAGKKLPQQQLDSVITIQCIEEAIGFEVHGHSQLMRPDTMLFFSPGEPHSLESREDSSVLVTMLSHCE
jgi:quercetin dioxygenase-like cupin family protein